MLCLVDIPGGGGASRTVGWDEQDLDQEQVLVVFPLDGPVAQAVRAGADRSGCDERPARNRKRLAFSTGGTSGSAISPAGAF